MDQIPDVSRHQFVFVFLLVITIYLIVNYFRDSTKLVKSLLVVAGGGMMVMGYKVYTDTITGHGAGSTAVGATKTSESEYMMGDVEGGEGENLVGAPEPGELQPITNNPIPFSSDDVSLSKYGNVSKDFDVDYLRQDSTKSLLADWGGFDNSNVVDAVMNQPSMFTPNEAYSRDYYNVKDRAWYLKHFQTPENIVVEGVTIPINERGVNADDSLTRRQITRGEINKKATDGAVRATKNLYERYFTHELSENYAREWWSGEGDYEDVLGSTELEYQQF